MLFSFAARVHFLPDSFTVITIERCNFAIRPSFNESHSRKFLLCVHKKKKIQLVFTIPWLWPSTWTQTRQLNRFPQFNRLPIMIFFLFFLQFDNVEACLAVLRQNQVGGLETITTNDICSGRLKAVNFTIFHSQTVVYYSFAVIFQVLSLFFSLSRYKQASKLKTPSKSPQTFIHHPQIHQQPAQLLNTSQGDMTKERWVKIRVTFRGEKSGELTTCWEWTWVLRKKIIYFFLKELQIFHYLDSDKNKII